MTETSIYTHAELSARLAGVERERDELAARVERLRLALQMARNAHYYDGWPHGWNLTRLDDVLAETPPTSLAEIRAEAVEAAANAMPDSTRPVYTHPQPAQQVPEGWSVRHIDDPGGDGYLVKGPCLNYIVWKDKEPWHYLFLDALLTTTNPMARDRKQKWKETGK